MERIDVGEIGKFVRGRPGLIIGQNETLKLPNANAVCKEIAKSFGIEPKSSINELTNELLSLGREESAIRREIERVISSYESGTMLSTISQVNWSAVLSFAMDRNFEIEMQNHALESASRTDVSTIHDFKTVIPPRTVPCFKLLDVVGNDRFPIKDSEMLRRTARWRFALENFSDRVQGNPVFVLGVTGQEDLFLKLLAETQAENKFQFSRLVFLDSDGTGEMQEISEVLGTSSKLISVNATLGQLVKSAVAVDKSNYPQQLKSEFADDELEIRDVVLKHSDLVFDVAISKSFACDEHDHNLIVERLFSPDSLQWDAFVFDYDFKRDLGEAIVSQIDSSPPNSSAAYTLTSGVASGKTTLLKRVAFDLVKKNKLVLWAKPCITDSSSRAIQSLFSDLAKLTKQKEIQIVVIVDDPYSFGMLKPRDFAFAAAKRKVGIHLLVGMRTSDAQLHADNSVTGELPIDGRYVLPDDLSDNEWARLPDFLVKLHIADSEEDAEKQCSQAESRASRDTLGTLYWLLPNVRQSLKGAVKQQYFRLGDYSTVKQVVVGGYETSADILKKAWTFTAVAEKYHSPLPLEVLVSALDVSYEAWLAAIKDSDGLAGILYESVDDIESTVCFRTRNNIVTEAIVEAVNGGVHGYSGEFSVLRDLVSACKGKGSVVYREFLVQLLVPYRKIEHLDPKDGLKLFETAIDSLTAQDKLIQHHRALWISHKMNDPMLAEEAFNTALNTDSHPYIDKVTGESDRYIRTSMASNEIVKIDRKLVPFAEGKEAVFNHLSKARSLDNCDSKIAHVQCRLVGRLVKHEDAVLDNDLMTFVSRAFSDVDRALIMLKIGRNSGTRNQDDEKRLVEIRDEVSAAIVDFQKLEQLAMDSWEKTKSQIGFVLCARTLYRKAVRSGKGGDFKKADNYCIRILGKIVECDETILSDLAEICLHNLCSWHLPGIGVSQSGIDWQRVLDLCEVVLAKPELVADPLNHFFRALAFAHLDDWAKVHAIFAKLRSQGLHPRVLFEPRSILVGKDGCPKKVQGVVKKNENKKFLSVEELSSDFRTNLQSRFRKEAETDFAFIEFSFAGPEAVSENVAQLRWDI